MNPAPRLLFALEYPIAYGGGVSVLVRTLLPALRDEFQLGLLSPDTPATLAASGVADLLALHLPWQAGRASRAAARELAGRIAAWQPAIVHFHAGGNYAWGNRRPGTSPIPLLRRRGIACVTTSHLIVSLLHHATSARLPAWLRAAALPLLWLGRLAALRATACEIAVSDHDLHLLQRWYFPLRSRFTRIYHSRLAAGGEPPPPPASREPVILHVGHRAVRKGQHRLVEAFCAVAERHPAWRLCLIGPPGDAAFEERLAATVRRHGLESRVQIVESRDGPEVLARMRRASLYVQPSLEEALGLALQEALFHGCACIGTRVGGIPELIAHEENGLLCAPDDPAALASALERLLSGAALRQRLATAAPAGIITREMTADRMIQRHRELYRSLLQVTRARSRTGRREREESGNCA
jgi:glycosyltransferase involved in cell wall biosynthesis